MSKKKIKEFWKELRKIKGNTTVSRCIDGTSILQDTVKIFDRKYKEVLDNSECQAHSVPTDPMLRGTNFSFTPKDLDVPMDRLNPGLGFDGVHTEQIKIAKRCYRNLQCSPPIRLFEYKECLHIVYGLQVPIPAYVFVMKFLSI